jgi:hypothetical protein
MNIDISKEARTHHQMLSFNVGDHVRFHPPGHDPKTGVIVKYNRKTVSVVTDDNHRWNVAPVFLSQGSRRMLARLQTRAWSSYRSSDDEVPRHSRLQRADERGRRRW